MKNENLLEILEALQKMVDIGALESFAIKNDQVELKLTKEMKEAAKNLPLYPLNY